MKKIIFFIFFLLFFAQMKAQDDKLGTKVIDIVKPYSASITDAKKSLAEAPKKDTISVQKKKINYTIYSAPVASTFVPDKGKASLVSLKAQEKGYDSYILGGAGNYTSFLADAYLIYPNTEKSFFELDLNHHSSHKGIKSVIYNNIFAKTSASVGYGLNGSRYQFGVSANIYHNFINWYGVRNKNQVTSENFKQNYLAFGAKSFVKVYNSFFKEADFSFENLSDDFNSSENLLSLKPSLSFLISEHWADVNFDVNFLKGSFKNDFNNIQKVDYHNLLFGINPSYALDFEEFTAKIGGGVYGILQNEKTEFKFFPNVEFSYYMLGGNFIPYAGVIGDLKQNSFFQQIKNNPFLSPTQNLKPSFTQFNAFLGLKGELNSTFDYNFGINFAKIDDFLMYKANPEIIFPQKPYQYTNSFVIVYDKVNVFGINANLNANFLEKLTSKINISYNNYSPEKEKHAWNLPSFKAELSADYNILKNWFVGTDIFFSGERKDFLETPLQSEMVSLPSFVDINLRTDYTFFKHWTAFVSAHNLLNKNYEKLTNYPIQGFQILVGVKYQFNLK